MAKLILVPPSVKTAGWLKWSRNAERWSATLAKMEKRGSFLLTAKEADDIEAMLLAFTPADQHDSAKQIINDASAEEIAEAIGALVPKIQAMVKGLVPADNDDGELEGFTP